MDFTILKLVKMDKMIKPAATAGNDQWIMEESSGRSNIIK